MPARCRKCGKRFDTVRAAKQHYEDVHVEGFQYDPPFPGIQGKWVSRDEFHGRSGFSRYECDDCGNRWGSARGMKRFRQACKRCEEWMHPVCMWQNPKDGVPSTREHDTTDPHDFERCEACARGQCVQRI